MKMLAKMACLVCLVTPTISACTAQGYSYHLRCWESYTIAADAALRKGDLGQAQKACQSAVTESRQLGSGNSHQIFSLNRLADVYLQEKNYPQATSYYRLALNANPESGAVKNELLEQERNRSLSGLGQASAKSGDKTKAEAFFKQALQGEGERGAATRAADGNLMVGRDMADSLFGLARCYQSAGDYQEALKTYNQCLATGSAAAMPDSFMQPVIAEYGELLKAMHVEANLHQLTMSLLGRENEEAGLSGEVSGDAAWSKCYQGGQTALARGHSSTARFYLTLALANAKAFSPGDPRLPKTMDSLAAALLAEGDKEKAKNLYLEALELRRASPATTKSDLALSLQNIAEFFDAQGEPRLAKPYYEEELGILKTILKPDELYMTKAALKLATIYFGEFDDAKCEPIYAGRLSAMEKRFGDQSLDVAGPMEALAAICFRRQRFQEASQYFGRVVDIKLLNGVTRDKQFLLDMDYYGRSCEGLSSDEQKEQCFRKLVSIWEKVDPNSQQMAVCLNCLAHACVSQRKYAEAQQYSQRALQLLESAGKPDLSAIYNMVSSCADILEAEHKFAEAMPYRKRQVEIAEQMDGPVSFNAARAYQAWANLEQATNPRATAEVSRLLKRCIETYQKLLEIQEPKLGPGHPQIILTYVYEAEAYKQLGDLKQAQQVCEIELHKLAANPPLLSPPYVWLKEKYAEILHLRGARAK